MEIQTLYLNNKMKEYQSYILDNGIRIVHMPQQSHVSYCGFIIDTGTRDEDTDEYGMAHFIEHMLFKGTSKRKAFHILNRMESVGGEINAYTNKEETVIYSAFLNEHYERAFELLRDLIFNSVFPEKEIEKEVDVIIDEINSYEDSPSELIFDEFENLIFRDSQLGHNILGYPETLKIFDTQKAKKFVGKNYKTDRIVFFSLGPIDFKKIIKLSQKYLADITSSQDIQNRINPSFVLPITKIEHRETNQAHGLIGGKCCNLYADERRALLLLNNILGGPGMNSRLNISLREKKGYVYNVESNATCYTDTGLFSIYFGCDKKNVEKCIDLTNRELSKLTNNSLTTQQLAAAKKQFIGQIAMSSDNHENQFLSLGKSFLRHNHYNSIEQITEQIQSITSLQILEIANKLFDKENSNTLLYN